MKRIAILIFILLPVICQSQLISLVVRNDTVFGFNPSTAVFTQYTKLVPPIAGQSGKYLTNNGSTYSWDVPASGVTQTTLDDSTSALRTSINMKQASGSYAVTTNNLSDLSNAATARTNLSLGNVDNTSDANKPVSSATQTALNLKANIAAPALTGAVTTSGSFGITAGLGSGGTVTQATNRSTGVTINKISGAITTNATSLAAGAEATFVVTNSTVAIGDVILLSARSGQTANTSIPHVSQVANGSFSITLTNLNGTTADTGAMVINFLVFKAVSN